MKFKLVYVEWIDPCAGPRGWNVLSEMEERDFGTNACKSVGWVIKQSKEFITLCPTIAVDHMDGEVDVADMSNIPRACIKKMVVIKKIK
jgi:hypothetical protein